MEILYRAVYRSTRLVTALERYGFETSPTLEVVCGF